MSVRTPWELRAATNADGPAIRKLIACVLAEYGIAACESTTESDLQDIETNYWRAGGVFYVLVEGSRTIGTVALQRESSSSCELCRMYLAASDRGRGLGRRLLNHALECARQGGFEEIRLETAAVLREAIALYRSVGFAVEDRPPVGANCDVLMRKRLLPA